MRRLAGRSLSSTKSILCFISRSYGYYGSLNTSLYSSTTLYKRSYPTTSPIVPSHLPASSVALVTPSDPVQSDPWRNKPSHATARCLRTYFKMDFSPHTSTLTVPALSLVAFKPAIYRFTPRFSKCTTPFYQSMSGLCSFNQGTPNTTEVASSGTTRIVTLCTQSGMSYIAATTSFWL